MPDRPVRIAPLTPAEWTPEVREFFEATLGAEKAATYHMPLTFARHPSLSRAIFEFSRKVQGSAEIPPRLREIIIMRVAWLHKTDYVWGQHNQIMRGLGMGDEHVQAVKAGADAPVWSADERSVLRVVDELAQTREVTDGAWKALSDHFSSKQILDILAVVGQYSMLALVFNAIGLQLETRFKEFALERS
jgi:4-carboxymuconolactone decarboxylase